VRRSLGCLALVLALCVGAVAVKPVAASTPQGAITWTVDDKSATITISVKLEIYNACSSCASAATQFLADKIKAQILSVWNKQYHYRCYELIFVVDVKRGTDKSHIDPDRLGVGIDQSPVPIRSFVSGSGDSKKWRSNDPADAVVPTNDPDQPSTWREAGNFDWTNIYAHEFGHVLGLSDAYEDKVDPATGQDRQRALSRCAPRCDVDHDRNRRAGDHRPIGRTRPSRPDEAPLQLAGRSGWRVTSNDLPEGTHPHVG
jgi:hypothetical protein